MMELKELKPPREKLLELFRKYKAAVAILAVGLVLVGVSEKSNEWREQPASDSREEECFSVAAMEKELGDILSQIDGAGKVSVMLTVRSGMERVLAVDQDIRESNGTIDEKNKIVTVSGKEGEEAVPIKQRYPTFQGALVVCPGGNDPQVQLTLTKALASLTGISSNRITVCKGS